MRTVFVLLCCVASCYQPSIQDGGFLCASGGVCPQGFSCVQEHCWSDTGPGPLVIQDGGASDLTALPEAGPRLRQAGETCDPVNRGTAERTDNCAPGLTCIDGNFQSVCFRRCAADADCGGSKCEDRSPEAGAAAVRVCALPATTCSPVDSKCPDQRVCYIDGDHTVCEITSGDNVRAACTYSRECLPGYTCAAGGPGAGYCRPACTIATTCPGDSRCQLSAVTMGYCY